MADQKVSDLPALNGADVDAADLLYIVDSSAGTAGSKRITIGQFQVAPYSGGTANGVMYFNGSKVVTSGSSLTFDGTVLSTTTVDTTNVEATNIKAKDGTSAATIADSTGVVSFTANPTLSGGTANGVTYLNGSKVLTSGSALQFDGTNLAVGSSPSATYRVFVGTGLTGGAFQADNGVNSGFVVRFASNLTLFGNDFAQPLAFLINNSEQMRLTSTGLGIGTSSPNAKLEVNGNVILGAEVYRSSDSSFMRIAGGNPAATGANLIVFGSTHATAPGRVSINAVGTGHVEFSAGGSERARITSGGDLLVGTNNASPAAGVGVKAIASGAVYVVNASGDGFDYYNSTAAAYRFYVTSAGTIYATNTTISAISDQRFKENIQDLDAGLEKIMALKPRRFDWKAGKGKDIKGDRGFIAQEFEQVFPDLIDEWKDPAPEGEEPYKSVRQDLIPVLVKAIQELKAELDSVKAELATLKGQP